MRIIALISAFLLFFTSCNLLNTGSSSVTTEEVVKGLKEALTVGTGNATSVLNATDGYFKDAAVKILLPPDAQAIYQYKDNQYFKAAGVTSAIDSYIDKTVLGINRAAESAAADAKPIFVDAITNLSISDGWDILNGKNPVATKAGTETASFDSSAATNYLKSTTFTDLVKVFSAPIAKKLGEDLGLGFSANDAWTNLTKNYNSGVEYYNNAIQLTSYLGSSEKPLTKVNSDLAGYATGKALDGLFLKLGQEEVKIRRDPTKWGSDIIERVFTEGIRQLTK